MAGTLTFEPVPTGTRMHWTWDVRPKPRRLALGCRSAVGMFAPYSAGNDPA